MRDVKSGRAIPPQTGKSGENPIDGFNRFYVPLNLQAIWGYGCWCHLVYSPMTKKGGQCPPLCVMVKNASSESLGDLLDSCQGDLADAGRQGHITQAGSLASAARLRRAKLVPVPARPGARWRKLLLALQGSGFLLQAIKP